MTHLDAGLIIGCYIAIITHVIWTFRSLREIEAEMNKHHQDAGKHVDGKELVFRDVCTLQVKRFEEKLEDVKNDVGEVKQSVNDGFKDLKTMIKEDRASDSKRDERGR